MTSGAWRRGQVTERLASLLAGGVSARQIGLAATRRIAGGLAAPRAIPRKRRAS
jgi:hypothetical protein